MINDKFNKETIKEFLQKESLQKFSMRLGEDSWQALVMNIAIMMGVCLILAFFFFYMYLPVSTDHGESITVPNVEKMSLTEATEKLKDRNLEVRVKDTVYNPNLPPLAVLKQNPAPASAVKEKRKIYLTVNALTPPETNIPPIIDASIKYAIPLLESAKLKLGKTDYIPDPAKNAVLKVIANGKTISRDELAKGYKVPQGTVIDLVLGDGLGDNSFEMPNLIGKDLEEVEMYLRGLGLTLGNVVYEKADDKEPNSIISQKPAPTAGNKVKRGTVVDLWVVDTPNE